MLTEDAFNGSRGELTAASPRSPSPVGFDPPIMASYSATATTTRVPRAMRSTIADAHRQAMPVATNATR